MSLISIIIPVYNTSLYLKQCVDSVCKQTYSNLEIILVDDGSTDDSPALCDDFATQDARIKVLHRQNGGLSAARNSGLSMMSGEHVAFIDSDDYISSDYIQRLKEVMDNSKSEMVLSGYQKFIDGQNPKIDGTTENVEVYSQNEARELMLRRKLPMYAHGKLYRASLFDDIRFPEGKLYEDVPTIWEIMKRVDKVSVVDKKLYYYRQRKGSIVNSSFKPSRMDLVEFSERIYREVQENSELRDIAGSRCFFAVADNYTLVTSEYPEIKRNLYKKIVEYRSCVMKDAKAGYLLKIMAMVSYVSPVLVRWIGKLYKMVK